MRKVILYLISAILLISVALAILFFTFIHEIEIKSGNRVISLYIPTGSGFEQVFDSINAKVLIRHGKVFRWIAARKNYPALIKPGHYLINSEVNYIDIINVLRSGNQTPVRVTFNNIRKLEDLAGKVGGQIEADSLSIIRFLNEEINYRKDGFTRDNVISVFIPDTYEFYWNTDPDDFYSRLLKEYRKFWNDDRLKRAKDKNLTPVQVSILASIVDNEAAMADEKPRIAGVYLNRLKKGIPLQADPTIKFALNDFTLQRILTKHLQVESPFNTYRYKGIPPGPIGCPTIEGIEAVLNAENHDFLFFVARADFSGYHQFSRTLAEHSRYAALYQKELDKRKIFR